MIYKHLSKLLFCGLYVGLFLKLAAQVPQGVNYQAIARDPTGVAYAAGTAVTVGFKISNLTSTYSENHSTTVGQFGLVNLVIGKGTTVSGSFATFDWSETPVTIDISIDGTPIGSQELQSVPYAMHCATTDAVSGGGLWTENGTDIYYDAGSVGVGVTTVESNADLQVKNRVLAGPAYVGNIYTGTSWAGIQHAGLKLGVNQYALLQGKDGGTLLNSFLETGQAIIYLQNNGIDIAHLTHEGDVSSVFNSKLLLKGTVSQRNDPAGKLSFEHTLSGTSYNSAEIIGGIGSAEGMGELRFNVLFKSSLINAMYIHEDASVTLSSLAGAAGLVGVDATGRLIPGGSITETDPQVGTITTSYVPRWSGASLVTGSIYDNGTNVGIGTSNPTSSLHIESNNVTPFTINMTATGGFGSSTGYNRIRLENGNSTENWLISSHAQIGTETTNNANFNIFYSGVGNVMSFRGDGKVGIGIDAPTLSRFQVQESAANNYVARFYNTSTSTTAKGIVIKAGPTTNPGTGNIYVLFYKGDDFSIGSITGNGSGGVLYSSVSDKRLKQNIYDLDNALNIINKLKPREYQFKSSPTINQIGFIAQELQQVFPQAVSGNPEGDVQTEPMMVDYSKLTPLLTKAIQEQQVLIEENQKLIQQLQEELNALKRQ